MERGRCLVLPCRSHQTTITKLIVYRGFYNVVALVLEQPVIPTTNLFSDDDNDGGNGNGLFG